MTHYSTFGREFFPIYSALKNFRYFLEGQSFCILTYHEPLNYAFRGNHNSYSSREIRHLAYISEFTTDIHFVKGLDNAAADALSRVPAVTLSPPLLHLEKLAASQWDDSELQFLQVSSKSLVLRTVSHPLSSPPLVCDTASSSPRPFAPVSFRRDAFHSLRDISPFGIKTTHRLIAQRLV